MFYFLAHIIPGLLLICILYVKSAYACIALMSFSLGFNGASAITNIKNAQDLSPNYASTLFSIINCASTINGFIVPMVVAYFTNGSVCIYLC